MKKYLRLMVVLISLATVLSGATQMISPNTVLNLIGGDITPSSSHFFAIVGMFMTLFGGLMLHAVYSPHPNEPAILWCAFQKLGAFVAVGLGVMNELFSMLALGVAVFDLFSGLIFLYYLRVNR